MTDFWYYADGKESLGPVKFDRLIEILSQVRDAREILLWRDGFEDWKPAKSIQEIAERLFRPPVIGRLADPPSLQQVPKQTQLELQNGKKELIGKRGWLALLGFQMIIGLLALFGNASYEWPLLFSSYPNAVRDLETTIYGLIALEVALLMLGICAVFLFFRNSQSFPFVFILLAILATLHPGAISIDDLGWGVIKSSFKWVPWEKVIVRAIVAALWIFYILKSKRVASTFVK
jgi:hypothetical protein